MQGLWRGPWWVAAGIAGTLLLAGCTDSPPTASSTTATTPPAATSASPVACDSIQVRDVDTVQGDWVLAETVFVGGVPGTDVTVDLPAGAAAAVSVGPAPESAPSADPVTGSTRSSGLTVEEATVITDPVTDLDPATLQEAIGPSEAGLLSLTNAGQAGFSGQLDVVLGAEGSVAYRGAKEVAVTFTGDCSGPDGEHPVTGTARFFDLAEAGALDCGKPPEPGTIAEAAAGSCPTD